MDAQKIIEELMALEALFEQGRSRCYSIRKELEPLLAPATLGEGAAEKEGASIQEKVRSVLQKRRSTFYKAAAEKTRKTA